MIKTGNHRENHREIIGKHMIIHGNNRVIIGKIMIIHGSWDADKFIEEQFTPCEELELRLLAFFFGPKQTKENDGEEKETDEHVRKFFHLLSVT